MALESVLFYADNRQQERFQKADRAYTLMEQQNYAEAALQKCKRMMKEES